MEDSLLDDVQRYWEGSPGWLRVFLIAPPLVLLLVVLNAVVFESDVTADQLAREALAREQAKALVSLGDGTLLPVGVFDVVVGQLGVSNRTLFIAMVGIMGFVFYQKFFQHFKF